MIPLANALALERPPKDPHPQLSVESCSVQAPLGSAARGPRGQCKRHRIAQPGGARLPFTLLGRRLVLGRTAPRRLLASPGGGRRGARRERGGSPGPAGERGPRGESLWLQSACAKGTAGGRAGRKRLWAERGAGSRSRAARPRAGRIEPGCWRGAPYSPEDPCLWPPKSKSEPYSAEPQMQPLGGGKERQSPQYLGHACPARVASSI